MQNPSSSSSEKIHPKRRSTNQYSRISNEEEIDRRARGILRELSTLLKKLHNNTLVLNYGNKVITAKPCDLIRVLSEWPQKDTLDLAIRNIILSAILSAENNQAGSGIICAYLLASHVSDDHDLTTRSTIKNRATVSDIENSLKYMLGGGVIYNVMKELIFAGGLAADLRFRTTPGNNFVITLSSTQEMLGEIPPLFKTPVKEIENAVVIAVDGVIESVGEIDHLLQEIAALKVKGVLLARGFSPDIITTLDINWKANKLKVVPYTVKLWEINEIQRQHKHDASLDGLHACQKININCISSATGGTLLESSLTDFTQHEIIFINENQIAFQAQKGNSLYAEIKIPIRMASLMGIIRDRCRIVQKSCMGMARSGACNKNFLTKIENLSRESTPLQLSYSAEVVGIKSARSCMHTLEKISTIVINE